MNEPFRDAAALVSCGGQDLVAELKVVENNVVRLQVENRCMERVLSNRAAT